MTASRYPQIRLGVRAPSIASRSITDTCGGAAVRLGVRGIVVGRVFDRGAEHCRRPSSDRTPLQVH